MAGKTGQYDSVTTIQAEHSSNHKRCHPSKTNAGYTRNRLASVTKYHHVHKRNVSHAGHINDYTERGIQVEEIERWR
jgi:hypothetical protein